MKTRGMDMGCRELDISAHFKLNDHHGRCSTLRCLPPSSPAMAGRRAGFSANPNPARSPTTRTEIPPNVAWTFSPHSPIGCVPRKIKFILNSFRGAQVLTMSSIKLRKQQNGGLPPRTLNCVFSHLSTQKRRVGTTKKEINAWIDKLDPYKT